LTLSGHPASLGRGLTSLVRTLPFLGLLAALAVVFPVVGGATPERATANTVTFQDSRGEDPAGPDIASTTVSNDNTGLISFKIDVPNQAQLSGEKLYAITIDADNNPATGEPASQFSVGGGDFAIELFQQQVNLFQWDGQNYTRSAAGPSQATLIFTDSPTGPTISINASELGGTKKLAFDVIAISGLKFDDSGNLDFSGAHADFAPDPGHGRYAYDVKTAPLKLLAKTFKVAPSRPRAGRAFTMSMGAVRNDTGAVIQSGTVACAAKAGGARLAPRVHRFVGRTAVCTWQIPSSARGKGFRGSITIAFEGKKVTKTFSSVVG
jgi:hypothetical protein